MKVNVKIIPQTMVLILYKRKKIIGAGFVYRVNTPFPQYKHTLTHIYTLYVRALRRIRYET